MNGYIIYEGESRIDNKPIVMIATGFSNSKNRKTGEMIQTWIIRSDIDPIKAVYSNDNFSVCGDCKHKPNTDKNKMGYGTCYVNVGQAPLGIYNAYKRGKYKYLEDFKIFQEKRVRLGAYGDPAAIPTSVLKDIVDNCQYHTAYTHQWKRCDEELKNICMASVDTPKEYEIAQQKGWRTFRVRTDDEQLNKNERICPASEEFGKKVQCIDCMACHGGGNHRASIAIVAHGSWKAKRFVQIRVRQKQHKSYSSLIKVSKNSVNKRVHV